MLHLEINKALKMSFYLIWTRGGEERLSVENLIKSVYITISIIFHSCDHVPRYRIILRNPFHNKNDLKNILLKYQ